MYSRKLKPNIIENEKGGNLNEDVFNISWSSSSSESDDKKHIKFCNEKKWINLKLLTNVPSNFTVGVKTDFYETDEPTSTPSYSGCNNSFLESPILNKVNKYQLSPLLCRNTTEDPFKTSPVIARYKRRKLCKRKLVPAQDIQSLSDHIQLPEIMPSMLSINSIIKKSPDLFASQSDFMIETQVSTQETIADITSCSPSKSEIEEFDIESLTSQDCDKIPQTDCTAEFEQLISTSSNFYHKPKRKKYKKGSLSRQVQQAINQQKIDTDIWKHELYLSKSSDYTLSWSESDESIKELWIKKIWVEYNKTLMLCQYLENLKYCILLINPTFVDINKLIIDRIFKLYPPYIVNKIRYDNSDVDCYLNVSKMRFQKQLP